MDGVLLHRATAGATGGRIPQEVDAKIAKLYVPRELNELARTQYTGLGGGISRRARYQSAFAFHRGSF